jgi:hypothetical protein
VASPLEHRAARIRLYRVIGRSVGIKIAALIVFFAIVVYLGVH